MFKKYLFLVFLLPSILFGQVGSISDSVKSIKFDDQLLAELTKKELSISSYEGVKIQGFMINGYPFINICKIQMNKNNNINNIQDIAFITPKYSLSDEAVAKQNLNIASQAQPVSIEREGSDGSGNRELVGYDFYTKDKKRVFSEWIDQNSGFVVKSATFDSRSNLIGFIIYLNLSIDKPFSNIVGPQKIKRFSLEKLISRQGAYDFNSVSDIERFVTEFLKNYYGDAL